MNHRLCQDVRFRLVGAEGVVIRQRAAEVVVVNEVGARVLQLVQDGVRRTKMHSLLLDEFEADASVLVADVDSFLRELVAAGILAEEPGVHD